MERISKQRHYLSPMGNRVVIFWLTIDIYFLTENLIYAFSRRELSSIVILNILKTTFPVGDKLFNWFIGVRYIVYY